MITKKLKDFEETLSPSSFIRVHNSYVVNINKIKEYRKSDAIIVLSNLKEIPVSRLRKNDFLDKLK